MSDDSDYSEGEGVKEKINPKASFAKSSGSSPNTQKPAGPLLVNISASESCSDNTHYNFNATMNEEQVNQKVAADIKRQKQATTASTILKLSAAISMVVITVGGLIKITKGNSQ